MIKELTIRLMSRKLKNLMNISIIQNKIFKNNQMISSISRKIANK